LVGAPTELVDETGEIAWHTRTTLWGTTWNRDATAYTLLRFPGQYADPETGPLGLAPSPNPATYVHNPSTWTDPLGLSPYHNQMPEDLAQELADAERLGVKPLRVGDDGFDAAVNSGTVKWAVDEQGDLFIIPKHVDGTELKHPVLTEGRPVLAAGEAEIAGSSGSYFGMDINNQSGHYKPSIESLETGRKAFERAGIQFFE
ncbi:RHS repeat domain-containing protein, partial [Streptomyces barkulensis]